MRDMKVEDKYLAKADKHLRKALETASDNEPMRVILTLDNAKDDASEPGGTTLSPADFESRTEYRKALIEQRKEWLAQHLAETREKLNAASLKLRGGVISRVIVADGDAGDIARSLSIPGIRKATLDKQISLPKIKKNKAFKSGDE